MCMPLCLVKGRWPFFLFAIFLSVLPFLSVWLLPLIATNQHGAQRRTTTKTQRRREQHEKGEQKRNHKRRNTTEETPTKIKEEPKEGTKRNHKKEEQEEEPQQHTRFPVSAVVLVCVDRRVCVFILSVVLRLPTHIEGRIFVCRRAQQGQKLYCGTHLDIQG